MSREAIVVPPFKSHLAKQLAKIINIEELDKLGDRKNYLISRLYKKKLEIYFEDSDNLLIRWLIWDQLFTKVQASKIPCHNSKDLYIDYKGELMPQHILDNTFDLNEYVMILREKKLQWKHIYYQVSLNF